MPLYKRVKKSGKPDKTGQEYEDYLADMKGKGEHKKAMTEYQWRKEMTPRTRQVHRQMARS